MLWIIVEATSTVSLSWFRGPRQCQRGPGEPSVDCVCFALVWPHRRGIWGQGVKTWLCIHGARMLWTIVDLQRRLRCRCHGFVALGSAKWALESQLWIVCVLPWFGLTDGAMGAKEWKLGFAYTVRARYGPVLTSSDDSGVVVMVSRPSAVPNEPWRANCELRVFCLGLASPTGHWGPRSESMALHTRCVRVMDQC